MEFLELLDKEFNYESASKLSEDDWFTLKGELLVDFTPLTYGEIVRIYYYIEFYRFLQFTERFRNNRLNDLCWFGKCNCINKKGIGKAVVAAALTGKFKQMLGYELMPSLYQMSN